jgi:hypothetical protein
MHLLNREISDFSKFVCHRNGWRIEKENKDRDGVRSKEVSGPHIRENVT